MFLFRYPFILFYVDGHLRNTLCGIGCGVGRRVIAASSGGWMGGVRSCLVDHTNDHIMDEKDGMLKSN